MSDALSNLLEDIRPRGALFGRSFLHSPWALRFEERAPLTLATMLHGDGWIATHGEAPTPIAAGDIAVVIGSEPYTISDRLDIAPQVIVHDGDLCTTPDGRPVDHVPSLACRPGVPAGDADGSAVLLKGTYRVEGSVCDRVLRGLPRVLIVPADALQDPSVSMIVTELTRARPGQQAVLDRLLDLLLVSTLREWLDGQGSGAPGWYQAHADAVVGAALRLMHDDPAQPWTVASLAARARVARATFARRFTDLVGEPPMEYLACWRLCLAADLLRTTDATIDSIARQVGYANGDALSVAFTRVHGIRPTEHRRASVDRAVRGEG